MITGPRGFPSFCLHKLVVSFSFFPMSKISDSDAESFYLENDSFVLSGEKNVERDKESSLFLQTMQPLFGTKTRK